MADLFCGGSPVVSFKHCGCGKPVSESEVYRCLDCAIPLHRDCLRDHCEHDLDVLKAKLASMEAERDSLLHALKDSPQSVALRAYEARALAAEARCVALVEALEEMTTQYGCDCGHPACKRCSRTREARSLLPKVAP